MCSSVVIKLFHIKKVTIFFTGVINYPQDQAVTFNNFPIVINVTKNVNLPDVEFVYTIKIPSETIQCLINVTEITVTFVV